MVWSAPRRAIPHHDACLIDWKRRCPKGEALTCPRWHQGLYLIAPRVVLGLHLCLPGCTMEPSASPREISFPLPKNADYILHMHLTFLETSLILFLTTTKRDESGSTLAAMGSFVYAMPDVCALSWTSTNTPPARDRLTAGRGPMRPMLSALPFSPPPRASNTRPARRRSWPAKCKSRST